MRHRMLSIFVVFTAILVLGACDNKLLHEFKNVDGEWMRNDTLHFHYYNAQENGTECNLRIELRTMPDYSYKDVGLQIKAYAKSYDAPITDTLYCNVYDDNGVYTGTTNGIMYQLSSQDIKLLATPCDTLRLSITHIMNDTLRGISDVGVRLLRCGRRQYAGN